MYLYRRYILFYRRNPYRPLKQGTHCPSFHRSAASMRTFCPRLKPYGCRFQFFLILRQCIARQDDNLRLKALKSEEEKNDIYSLITMFETGYPYYFDIIRYGKSDKKAPEDYDDSIRSPEDLIKWLTKLNESISKRKGGEYQNGKTNEKGNLCLLDVLKYFLHTVQRFSLIFTFGLNISSSKTNSNNFGKPLTSSIFCAFFGISSCNSVYLLV